MRRTGNWSFISELMTTLIEQRHGLAVPHNSLKLRCLQEETFAMCTVYKCNIIILVYLLYKYLYNRIHIYLFGLPQQQKIWSPVSILHAQACRATRRRRHSVATERRRGRHQQSTTKYKLFKRFHSKIFLLRPFHKRKRCIHRVTYSI